ncbi:MAG TPA: helix-turn-helix domain-containing GNAT family N-acetyltransferase [Bryobacteraceae bacterium]|jgi:DNA-binding MarR family transcriptional regulator/GNAT superfamily N-acetyltransferase
MATGSVPAVRAFNRFYTRKIGILEEGLLQTRFSLVEVRVLYELAHRDQSTAAALAAELGLDPGYLSRILSRFKGLGYISRKPSPEDGRQSLLSLTAKGRTEFAKLDVRQNHEVEELLEPLSDAERTELTAAMGTVERLLNPTSTQDPFILRGPRVGDMGLVVAQQALLYQREYGWDERFEALLAKIAGQFIDEFDPKREKCWIAERGGEVVGAIFLVKTEDPKVAKLRMLYVNPSVRGLGIGNRLVEECIRFARDCKYRKITLWTQSILVGARRIYERNGFKLVKSWPYRDIGHDLISETWELEL